MPMAKTGSPEPKVWLKRIHDLPLPANIKVMNVCGGHERAISMAGIRSLLPPNIELIPGPGCPVCICPEEDIYQAMQLALHEDLTLVAFGDMLRVPVNVPKKEPRFKMWVTLTVSTINPAGESWAGIYATYVPVLNDIPPTN